MNRFGQIFLVFLSHSVELTEQLLDGAQSFLKSLVPHLVKKFLAFYWKGRFIRGFTTARLLSLSWARWIQSTPCEIISFRSIPMLSSHLLPGLPNVFKYTITIIRQLFVIIWRI